MNANAVSVAVVDGKTITSPVELGGIERGNPVRVQAIEGGAYLLTEGEHRLAPQNVTVKRVGKDLHLSLERSEPDQPQLIIEGFFGTSGQLVGIAEDGSFHEYVSADALAEQGIADGSVAALALGATPLAGFGIGGESGGFWTPAMMGLGALGVAGAIAAIAGGGSGGGGQAAPGPRPEPEPEPETEPQTEIEIPLEPEELPVQEQTPGDDEEPLTVGDEANPAEQPNGNVAAADQDSGSVMTLRASEPMFDYSAVTQLDHPQAIADQVWTTALSLADVLSFGPGELFVEDATAPAISQWIYETEDVDLNALISDDEAENWTADNGLNSTGVVVEMARPSVPVDEALFHAQE